MGYMRAAGMAMAAKENKIGLDIALLDHFQGNMYPPVPLVMIDTAKEAIHSVSSGDPDAEITSPHCIVDGRQTYPAHKWVQIMRLEGFVDVLSPQ